MRVPTPLEIEEVKKALATLQYRSPGNSQAKGVPYQEIFFPEFGDTSSKRNQSKQRLDAICTAVDIRERTVFDLGCNIGYFCFGLASAGARCFGIDYDNDSIELANKLKRLYDTTDVTFSRSAITREALHRAVAEHGVPDVILLNSIVHWLMHAHDTVESIVHVLTPLLSSEKRQAIIYEPSSTGAAFYPEVLTRKHVDYFFTSFGVVQWEKLGNFQASNASQTREYFVGFRDIQQLTDLCDEFLESKDLENSLLGPNPVRTRKNGKLRGMTDRFFVKSHEENDVFAKALIENEARTVGAFCSSRRPFILSTRVSPEKRSLLIYRREKSKTLADSWIRVRDLAIFEREVAALLSQLQESGLIHNDITPQNLLWDSPSKRLTLLDFEFTARAGEMDVDLQSYFGAFLPPNDTRLSRYLDDLGGKWRLTRGIGSFANDRFAAKSLLYSIKDRKRYAKQWIIFRITSWSTRVYRMIVPSPWRRKPAVTSY